MLTPITGALAKASRSRFPPTGAGNRIGKVTGAEVRDRKCWKHLLLSPSTPLRKSSSHLTGKGGPAPSLQSCFGQSPSGIPTLQRGNLRRAWLRAATGGGMVGITDGSAAESGQT